MNLLISLKTQWLTTGNFLKHFSESSLFASNGLKGAATSFLHVWSLHNWHFMVLRFLVFTVFQRHMHRKLLCEMAANEVCSTTIKQNVKNGLP